ncbi:response regulator [Fusobacterium mortiferum]|uniref:Transcriptional regulatory protein n=1 Tax=Fusobacterium mortiferum TaxID=850 RepID=A0ABS2G465_FUSMR|nr:response regulator [Fusobacterium mortiferum]MBM6875887.1 response regulator [Fusobacterium mortiferum]
MKNVLIVEDDPMVAMINEEYLSTFQNIKILGRTYTEKDTLKFLTTHKVDLIILDVFLGEENGIDILKSIRTLGYTTDVIMITSANGGEDIKKAFSLGCIDYLIKPFDFERLKLSIDKIFTRDEILNKTKIKQDSIDNIQSISPVINVKLNLPKGLNSKTLDKITQIIDNLPSEEFGIKDICQITDISNVTIKKYLDYLEAIKYIASFTNYGNVGRPLYLYRKIR